MDTFCPLATLHVSNAQTTARVAMNMIHPSAPSVRTVTSLPRKRNVHRARSPTAVTAILELILHAWNVKRDTLSLPTEQLAS